MWLSNLNIFSKFTLKKGIETSRILAEKGEKIEASLRCKNCHLLVCKPLHCSKCDVLYCQLCAALNWSDLCGICNTTPLSTTIPQIFRIMLSKYRITCRNKDEHCDFVLFYENLEDHEDNCHQERILCLFPDCKEKTDRRNYQIHVQNCQLRIVSCRFCLKDFKFLELGNHEFGCEMRMIDCNGCQRTVMNKFVNDHIEICSKLRIFCEYCQLSLARTDIDKHTKIDCFAYKTRVFRENSVRELDRLIDEVGRIELKLESINYSDGSRCATCERNGCSADVRRCGDCNHCFCRFCQREFWQKRQREGCLSCIYCANQNNGVLLEENESEKTHSRVQTASFN